MGFLLFGLIVATPLAIWGFAKLRKSKFVDRLTDDLVHEPDTSFEGTDDLIGTAEKAKSNLDQRVKDNATAAKEIKRDTEKIKEYKGENKEGGSDRDKRNDVMM